MFRGLWIDQSDYTWEAFPVLRFDFSSFALSEDLETYLNLLVHEQAEDHEITLPENISVYQAFRQLIRRLGKAQGPVVILIDEYDKPLIDVLENAERADHHQTVLKNFYTIIKASDEFLRFAFLIGVSKFARVGVFSGLNNLTDLSFDPRYANLLGWDQQELETNFHSYIQALAEAHDQTYAHTLEIIRERYKCE